MACKPSFTRFALLRVQVSELVWSGGVDERIDFIPGPTDDSPGVPNAGN